MNFEDLKANIAHTKYVLKFTPIMHKHYLFMGS